MTRDSIAQAGRNDRKQQHNSHTHTQKRKRGYWRTTCCCAHWNAPFRRFRAWLLIKPIVGSERRKAQHYHHANRTHVLQGPTLRRGGGRMTWTPWAGTNCPWQLLNSRQCGLTHDWDVWLRDLADRRCKTHWKDPLKSSRAFREVNNFIWATSQWISWI